MSPHRQNADLRTLCIFPTRRRRLPDPFVVGLVLFMMLAAWVISAQMDIDAKRRRTEPLAAADVSAAYERGVEDAMAAMQARSSEPQACVKPNPSVPL